MSDKALATVEQLAIEDVKRLANIVLALREDVFKEGHDFGKIPGTGDKPTLLLPGMEKLMRALHLRAEYVERSKLEDFDNNRIYYRYECRLIDYKTSECVATAIGSANSLESKWRWREAKRVCPKCGKDAINRSKYPPRGAPQGTEPGWYCYAKIGGCGAEFTATDPAIMNQQIGRVENPDIFDQMNTIDKIAQKRALSSAIKGAANVSEFFTVDIEDFQSYDTAAPIVVMPDDGRPVDTATGEITPPAPSKLPPDPIVQVDVDENGDEVVTFASGATTQDPALANLKAQTAAFDDVALATRNTDQPLALVDKPEAPVTHKWDVANVKTHAIGLKRYVKVSAHFDNLIADLYKRERINDNTTTEGVIAEIDLHYADGHHLTKGKKKAS